MAQSILYIVIRHRFQVVLVVIVVVIRPVPPGYQLLQVPVFILAALLLVPCGLHRHQLPVLVVLHRLRHFLGQGQIVKIRHVPVPFVGADHTDALHLGVGLLRHNGQGGILPLPHIRVEGHIVILLAVVAIGHLRSQTKLLVLVPGCRILSFRLLLVIWHRVRFCPPGQHIALPGLVYRNLLIPAALRICVSYDANAMRIFSFLK